MEKKLEEQVVQEFPYRCPYCEQIVSYDDLHLKPGENEIKCLSCKKKYIKVVPDDFPPTLSSRIAPGTAGILPPAFAEAPALRKASRFAGPCSRSGGGASRRQASRKRGKN